MRWLTQYKQILLFHMRPPSLQTLQATRNKQNCRCFSNIWVNKENMAGFPLTQNTGMAAIVQQSLLSGLVPSQNTQHIRNGNGNGNQLELNAFMLAPIPGKSWYPGDGGKGSRWLSMTWTWGGRGWFIWKCELTSRLWSLRRRGSCSDREWSSQVSGPRKYLDYTLTYL